MGYNSTLPFYPLFLCVLFTPFFYVSFLPPFFYVYYLSPFTIKNLPPPLFLFFYFFINYLLFLETLDTHFPINFLISLLTSYKTPDCILVLLTPLYLLFLLTFLLLHILYLPMVNVTILSFLAMKNRKFNFSILSSPPPLDQSYKTEATIFGYSGWEVNPKLHYFN